MKRRSVFVARKSKNRVLQAGRSTMRSTTDSGRSGSCHFFQRETCGQLTEIGFKKTGVQLFVKILKFKIFHKTLNCDLSKVALLICTAWSILLILMQSDAHSLSLPADYSRFTELVACVSLFLLQMTAPASGIDAFLPH